MIPKKIKVSRMEIPSITCINPYSLLCDDESNHDEIKNLTMKIEELSKKLIEYEIQIAKLTKENEHLKNIKIEQYNKPNISDSTQLKMQISKSNISEMQFSKPNISDSTQLEMQFSKPNVSDSTQLEMQLSQICLKPNITVKSNEKIIEEKLKEKIEEKNEEKIEDDESEWEEQLKVSKTVYIEFSKIGTYGDKLIKPEQCSKIISFLINNNNLFTKKDIYIIKKAINFVGSHGFYNPKIDNDKDLHKICTAGAITCACNILFKSRDETIKFRKQLREHYKWFIDNPTTQIDHSMLKSHSLGPYDDEQIFLKKFYEYMLSEGLNCITDAYCKKP